MSEQSNIKKGLVLVVYVLDTTNERCNAMSFAKDSKTGRFRCIASYQSGNLDWAKCNIRLLRKSEYEKTFPQGYEIEDAGEVVTMRGELLEFFDKAQELLARKYAELAGEAEVDFQSPTLRESLEYPKDTNDKYIHVGDAVHMLNTNHEGDHEWDDIVLSFEYVGKGGGDVWLVHGKDGAAWACECEVLKQEGGANGVVGVTSIFGDDEEPKSKKE